MNYKKMESILINIPVEMSAPKDTNDIAKVQLSSLNDDESTKTHPFLHIKFNTPSTKSYSSFKNITTELNDQPGYNPNLAIRQIRNIRPSPRLLPTKYWIYQSKQSNQKTFCLINWVLSGVEINQKLYLGERKSNKEPLKWIKYYGEIVHSNIGFGAVTVHGWINYSILFVDKAMRSSNIQTRNTLESKSLLKVLSSFTLNFGIIPRVIRILNVQSFLDPKDISVEAALLRRQDQNSLV